MTEQIKHRTTPEHRLYFGPYDTDLVEMDLLLPFCNRNETY